MRSRLDVVSAGLSSRIGARHASLGSGKRLITIKYRGDGYAYSPTDIKPSYSQVSHSFRKTYFIYNVLRHMLAPKAPLQV